MAANAGVGFFANVDAQMEVAAGLSFTFGSFPEVTVSRNPTSNASTLESGTTARVRSDLTFPSSITSQVSELDIADMATSRPRVARRPAVSVDNLFSLIDRVSRSIAECIQLGEDALLHRNNPDCIPYGLRNNAATY